MWRSTFLGISTNVVIYGVLEGHYKPEASYDGVAQYGATLTFQGSILNQTVRVVVGACCVYFQISSY